MTDEEAKARWEEQSKVRALDILVTEKIFGNRVAPYTWALIRLTHPADGCL